MPKIVLAPDAVGYRQQLMALIAKAHDTHANLWSSMGVRPPIGPCRVDVGLRFVDHRAIVAKSAAADREAATGLATGLMVGDEITAIDGAPVATLIEAWTPYYAVSNEASRLRDISRSMTGGACGPTKFTVRRADGERLVDAMRVPEADLRTDQRHDLAGPTFRLLSDDVAYLKLSSIKDGDVAAHLEAARDTKGMVIDLRNYPSAFVVFALGNLLVDGITPFARFTRGEVANPGAFRWTEPMALQPSTETASSRYRGKLAILVDEVSQSQAEYTTMALRSVPGALVVGSTTAGADGNVSAIPLPSGLWSWVSGLGVFYPDRRPTQRIGIVPDREVRPTVAGIRAGRDEVLEAGVSAIVGAASAADVMTRLERH